MGKSAGPAGAAVGGTVGGLVGFATGLTRSGLEAGSDANELVEQDKIELKSAEEKMTRAAQNFNFHSTQLHNLISEAGAKSTDKTLEYPTGSAESSRQNNGCKSTHIVYQISKFFVFFENVHSFKAQTFNFCRCVL